MRLRQIGNEAGNEAGAGWGRLGMKLGMRLGQAGNEAGNEAGGTGLHGLYKIVGIQRVQFTLLNSFCSAHYSHLLTSCVLL